MTGHSCRTGLLAAAMALLAPFEPTSNAGSPPPPPPPVIVLPPPPGPVIVPPLPVVGPKIPPAVTDQATGSITRQLAESQATCARVPTREYTIDCLGDALEHLADTMPSTGDYAEAKAAIAQAGQKLRSLARENASPDLPGGHIRTPGEGGKRASFTPLTPVRSDTLADLNTQATAILAEAETILLRSAANSAARKVHYQRIAQAVGSSKVLLRSS